MGRHHSYGLDWIDEDKLFDVASHCFSRLPDKARKSGFNAPPDPFTIATQAVLFDQDSESMMAFEKLRAINKTISNSVGEFHQSVLGLADGWNNLGPTGGVVDLMVSRDDGSRLMAVEVKNRYNTIKASDEKSMWDKLDLLSRSQGGVGYIVQIVPKTAERYDRPWQVSGRQPRETVRCCDGATAYELAFHRRDALKELYGAFPDILTDVFRSAPYGDKEGILQYYAISMPL